MRITRTAMFLFVAGVVFGCVPIPSHEVTSGREISDEDVLFLEQGLSTKGHVLERLGDPSIIWGDENLFAYRWDVVELMVAWIAVAPGAYDATAGVVDVPSKYLLLIQFDEADRVKHFERTKLPTFMSIGDFLREWVGQR